MARSTLGQALTDIEREIEAELRNAPPVHQSHPVNFTSPRVSAPALSMPDYVEHHDGATEIGKLSAEAVVREYEAAAKDIEAMGAQLIERVKQCEAMISDSLTVIEDVKGTAARYREEAKRVFTQIEHCSLLTAEVRKTCVELKERIAAPAVETEGTIKAAKPVRPSAKAS
jgi:hypothetical protein